MNNQNNKNFYIHHFDDYHTIECCFKGQKAIELGCFPTRGYNYNRYFGLFYTGRKPSLKLVLLEIKKMIDFKKFKIQDEYDFLNFEKDIKEGLK